MAVVPYTRDDELHVAVFADASQIAAEDTGVGNDHRGDEGVVDMFGLRCGHVGRSHEKASHDGDSQYHAHDAQRIGHGTAERRGGRVEPHLCERLLRGGQRGRIGYRTAQQSHHLGQRHARQKAERHGHSRTRRDQEQSQRVEPYAVAAECAEKTGTYLHAERIDEQHQTEVLHEIENRRVDRQSEVSGHDTGKKYACHAERNAPDAQLAQSQPHGAYQRQERNGGDVDLAVEQSVKKIHN